MQVLEQIEKAAKRNIEAWELLQNKRNVQGKVRWNEHHTNLPLMGKIDFDVSDDLMVDLKSSVNVSAHDFAKDCYGYFYWLQDRIYTENGKRRLKFLVVGKEPPFHVQVYEMDKEFKAWAMNEFLGLMQAFQYALEAREFDKGYEFLKFSQPQLRLPNYAYTKFGG